MMRYANHNFKDELINCRYDAEEHLKLSSTMAMAVFNVGTTQLGSVKAILKFY